ncbi:hypothetical protein GDO81_018527 [Engystomops pustulosus]|uniref:CCHC-type domain-containing protein n=1 Tax=Engystomops pustulosus TaxID=76066 RepID=A0AAV6Z0B3_ENGPU|nr:hypothetical protein GDO81_018527 [Engystomops pustulosus]
MGPLAETYRNQERFQAQRHHGGASNPATETKGKPILQPATFPYQQGDLYKKDKAMKQQPPTAEAPQVPAACNQQKDHSRPSEVTRAVKTPHVPAFSVQHGHLPDGSEEQAPQVPGDGSLQQDCAPDPEGNTVASEQDHQDSAGTDCTDIDGTSVGDTAHTSVPNAVSNICDTAAPIVCDAAAPNVGDNADASVSPPDNTIVCDNVPAGEAQSVWDVAIEQAEQCMEADGGEGIVQSDAQDFPPLVAEVSDPQSAGAQQPPQRPQTQQGTVPHQSSSGNAWSRGAPSFSSGSHYTGQAFKRRNVVRFRHKGAKEDLPDRRFVVRSLLCEQMGFSPSDILAVINLPDRQGYDVSFKLMGNLDRFWAIFRRFRDAEGWNNFSFIPISKLGTVTVTVIFWNESVPQQDIVIWLKRHCDLMSELTKTRDEDGIWTGGCFKCGRVGHIASNCSVVKCSLCGDIGHVSADCQNIRCNLCGEIGHAHRDCPNAWHNICKSFPDEDLLAGADDLGEEEALLLGSDQATPEPHQVLESSDAVPTPDQPQTQTTEGDMEVVQQRRKKDRSTRKPEGEWTTVHKSSKIRVDSGIDMTMTVNRFSVLSESDAEEELEKELQRMVAEYDEDPDGDPPSKRRPHRVGPESESDMETGGEEEGSDPDLR